MRYLLTHLDTAWELTVIHVRLSLIPIVLGLLIAVPLGALVQRTTYLRRLTTVTASIIFTIPSLALFVVLPLIIPPLAGTGSTTVFRWSSVIGSVSGVPSAASQFTRSLLRAYERSWFVLASGVSRQTQQRWKYPSGPRTGPCG